MGVLSTTPTYAPDLAASSTSATAFSTASPNTGSSSAIQPHTILAIVIGLVCFIILIIATAFISRLPCLSRSRNVEPKAAAIPLRRNVYTLTNDATPDRRRLSRARPPIYHVDQTIVTPSTPALAALRAPRGLFQTFDLPPYGGPSPPAYAENAGAVQPPQRPP